MDTKLKHILLLKKNNNNMAPGTERLRGAYRVVKTLYCAFIVVAFSFKVALYVSFTTIPQMNYYLLWCACRMSGLCRWGGGVQRWVNFVYMWGGVFGYLICVQGKQDFVWTILTLKWSRGVPMDPKISFHALARKRKVIGRSPYLTLSNFTLALLLVAKKICTDHAQVLLISINKHF